MSSPNIEGPTIRPPFRSRGPSLLTTFQFAADVHPGASVSGPALYSRSIETVLRWLQPRYPEEFPRGAYRGESFDCELLGTEVRCISLQAEKRWVAQLIQPDAPLLERKGVPGRHWSTEVALASQEESVRLGVRVACASQPYAQDKVLLTRPRVVRDFAHQLDLRDVRKIDGITWILRDESDLVRFHEVLSSPRRQLPVYLLTQPDPDALGLNVREFLLDHERLARELLGLAHVVALPARLGYSWTKMVGREWSAFRGAVRTYKPGLRFSEDLPSAHPFALAERVLAFQYESFIAEEAFETFLINQAYLFAASHRVSFEPCILYVDAHKRRAELARQNAKDVDDLNELYEDENASLRDKIADLEKESEAYSDGALRAEQKTDYYKEENRRLRSRIGALSGALEGRVSSVDLARVEQPESLSDLADWAERALAGRLTVHARAARELKGARYTDVKLVCDSLVLLANEYRQMRLGQEGAQNAWQDGLKRLGLDFGRSITEQRAGEEGDTYYVQYPPYSGQKSFLQFHLRKGNSKDERFCLAIYFFWDEGTQEVVVGWLPSHLDNRLT